ncbi:unnamed protein product [Adineta steineri]|uniref:Uncharacterized protein n=1 Tax=Adineta steineri TaxID=433720 RepID=A0A814R6M2_9BILA|nr:unnamed protein product [Adineta steineri]
MCSNATLCAYQYSCGNQCYSNYQSACVNNETICINSLYNVYGINYQQTARVCGPQKQCYDITTGVCLDYNNGTVCAIGSQLCSGACYNPQSQYCTGGNNTIYCQSNPSSSLCSVTSTTTTTLTTTVTSSTCCTVQNCTTNSDCCQPAPLECQCYRHNATDIYGSCANPNITPICGTSCPVQSKCKQDLDCCKCQCADITFTDSNGQIVTNKQCVRR